MQWWCKSSIYIYILIHPANADRSEGVVRGKEWGGGEERKRRGEERARRRARRQEGKMRRERGRRQNEREFLTKRRVGAVKPPCICAHTHRHTRNYCK